MFTSKVMAIKLSKMALFIFSGDDSKKLVIAWAKYLSEPKRSYCVLSEDVMVNRF